MSTSEQSDRCRSSLPHEALVPRSQFVRGKIFAVSFNDPDVPERVPSKWIACRNRCTRANRLGARPTCSENRCTNHRWLIPACSARSETRKPSSWQTSCRTANAIAGSICRSIGFRASNTSSAIANFARGPIASETRSHSSRDNPPHKSARSTRSPASATIGQDRNGKAPSGLNWTPRTERCSSARRVNHSDRGGRSIAAARSSETTSCAAPVGRTRSISWGGGRYPSVSQSISTNRESGQPGMCQ